jgi:hypothetical protein
LIVQLLAGLGYPWCGAIGRVRACGTGGARVVWGPNRCLLLFQSVVRGFGLCYGRSRERMRGSSRLWLFRWVDCDCVANTWV